MALLESEKVGGIEKLYEVSGTLTQNTNFYNKNVEVDSNVLKKYEYLILVLYSSTTTEYGTYIPFSQAMCPSAEIVNNDGHNHYIRVASRPSQPSDGYIAQLSKVEDQFLLQFVDYTKTYTYGKTVLYGIK